ncbi:MAG: hypothetical protein ACLQVI_09565 [Polyangiaceae bacterium]
MNQPQSQGYGPPAVIAQPVVVMDVRMSFVSMMTFMVKWALASIPAMLILSFIFGMVGMAFFMMVAALGLAATH